eukprot:TCONS_00022841-protein
MKVECAFISPNLQSAKVINEVQKKTKKLTLTRKEIATIERGKSVRTVKQMIHITATNARKPTQSKNSSLPDVSETFKESMIQGKVEAAVHLLSECEDLGVLSLDIEIIKILNEKHSEESSLFDEMLFTLGI